VVEVVAGGPALAEAEDDEVPPPEEGVDVVPPPEEDVDVVVPPPAVAEDVAVDEGALPE
jgi:hypothetical protein